MNIPTNPTPTPRQPVFFLLFQNPEGEQFAHEMMGPSLEEVIAFIEKRDGVKFVSEITMG